MQVSKKVAVMFGVLGLAAGTAGTIAMQTHAAGTTTTAATVPAQNSTHMHMTPPAASGSVTAVNGNTLTVTDKRSGTVYTVDASGATVEKFTAPSSADGNATPPAARPTPTTITVADVKVGDNVSIEGTVSGTNIAATKITDGMVMFGGGRGGFMGHGGPQGAFGTVSAINGNTITLTGKDGKTYTVDASSTTVNKVTQSSVSGIAVGDTLEVNGKTNGTSITANQITDGIVGLGKSGQPATTTSPPANQ